MPKDNSPYAGAMKELREALAAMQARAPGKPAVAIPLEHVMTFKGENGEPRGVIEVEQVIYLVGEILRTAAQS